MSGETRLGNGRYVVRGVLGEGAQGRTYDAVDPQSGRAVAIKRFDVRGAKSWKDVELAEREARVLATLDHPLLPRYVEHFEEDGALFLVMEKVDGETLDSIIKRQGPLPEEEVQRFLACASNLMTYLHGRSSPVVHRDIKPRNVVRRRDGTYVIVDFGAVSELLHRRGGSTIVGTLGFMAPEQLQGRAMPATDVYATGATALTALTGTDPEALPHQGLRVDVQSALQGRASPAMIASLERMLEPDPELRPTSLAASLNMPASHVPMAQVAPNAFDQAKEDAAVKSARGLLWALWGISWVIVPLVVHHLHQSGQLIPLIMFGSMAGVFILTWHKGAALRMVMRILLDKEPPRATTGAANAPRHRIELPPPQVRVQTMGTTDADVLGQTEVETRARSQASRR
jgi:serine/threonine protein kinase